MTGKVGRVIPTSGTEVFKGADHDGKGLVAQSRHRFSEGDTLNAQEGQVFCFFSQKKRQYLEFRTYIKCHFLKVKLVIGLMLFLFTTNTIFHVWMRGKIDEANKGSWF